MSSSKTQKPTTLNQSRQPAKHLFVPSTLVWAKLRRYRAWPAVILDPTRVSRAILRKRKKKSENILLVYFLGSETCTLHWVASSAICTWDEGKGLGHDKKTTSKALKHAQNFGAGFLSLDDLYEGFYQKGWFVSCPKPNCRQPFKHTHALSSSAEPFRILLRRTAPKFCRLVATAHLTETGDIVLVDGLALHTSSASSSSSSSSSSVVPSSLSSLASTPALSTVGERHEARWLKPSPFQHTSPTATETVQAPQPRGKCCTKACPGEDVDDDLPARDADVSCPDCDCEVGYCSVRAVSRPISAGTTVIRLLDSFNFRSPTFVKISAGICSRPWSILSIVIDAPMATGEDAAGASACTCRTKRACSCMRMYERIAACECTRRSPLRPRPS